MEKATKLSTIGLGISLGLAWSIGVLIVGIMRIYVQIRTTKDYITLSGLFNLFLN